MMMTKLVWGTCLLIIIMLVPLKSDDDPNTMNLMPVPKEMKLTGSRFRLDDSFTIGVQGEYGQKLTDYATRVLRRLSGRTGLFFPQHFIRPDSQVSEPTMHIKTRKEGMVKLGMDESYDLTITPDQILLSAPTDIGAMRGLETFLQLLYADLEGYYFPTVEIHDAPRFPWRGLLIDVSRHFLPVAVIKRNIDGLAALKMNVLHLHLTDDQGFRIECNTFPKLHLEGSDGLYFTQTQIKEIIDYARSRGIRIVPEFDVPAHTTSWFVGYPELASAPGPYSIEREWGIQDPVMDPTQAATYQFLDQFFAEMAALFPDEYMHIGGDENNGKQWKSNQAIQTFMEENNIPDKHALQTYFNNRVLEILTKHNKKMVGWDEILQPDLPKNVVVQSWRGHEAMNKAAKMGYQSILSRDYYLDLIKSAEYHYRNDPVPADSPLTPAERQNILGGEATSWGELITAETVDSRIWPRNAAIAERLWSPSAVRDIPDMYRRMDVTSFHLEELGLTHIKNYPMMLRRLTNNNEITPLKHFVDVVQQVQDYQRHFLEVKYTQSSPLTRVVDAARPESRVARHFNQLIDQYLAERQSEQAQEIAQWLKLWQRNHAKLLPVIQKSPILAEIESLSEDLAKVAETGQDALEHLETNRKTSWFWYKASQNCMQAARKPRGQVELTILNAIEKLVEASRK